MCHGDFELAPYEPLLVETAQLQRDLHQLLGVGAPTEPVHLYLFAEKGTYQQYMKGYFPDVPSRRALFIKARGPGMVFAYRNNELDIDLRHESTHALLHSWMPMVPLWLDEGLAEYFEVPAQQRAYENPHLNSIKWNLRFGLAPKISDLEALRSLDDMGRSEYRDAWSWVHFMLHGSAEAHDELVRFLADIRAQIPPGKLSDRLARRVPELERRFSEHFKNWRR